MYIENQINKLQNDVEPYYCVACNDFIVDKESRYLGPITGPTSCQFCDNCLKAISKISDFIKADKNYPLLK